MFLGQSHVKDCPKKTGEGSQRFMEAVCTTICSAWKAVTSGRKNLFCEKNYLGDHIIA